MEIDYECLKESFDENIEKLKEFDKNKQDMSETFQNTNSLVDKQFFNNLKNIEEMHNKKQKEVLEKYDILFKNLHREHRSSVTNIKKMCFENKNKIVNNRPEEEEILALSQVEELINQFENKVKLIYEEMKNKEKYISVIEQKYEMINEENKFLKRKVTEEKTALLRQIDEIQRERDNQHTELVRKFEEEIALKKNNLQKHIEQSLETNEKLIFSLTRERDESREKVEGLKRNINDIRNELTLSIQEREELDAILMGREITQKDLTEKLELLQKELKSIRTEKNTISKIFEETSNKLQESTAKNMSYEKNNKILNENLVNTTNELRKVNDENEKKRQSLINNYSAEIFELNQKVSEFQLALESETNMAKFKVNVTQKLENDKYFEKKIINPFEDNKVKENLDKLKIENNDISSKLRILIQERDEEKSIFINY